MACCAYAILAALAALLLLAPGAASQAPEASATFGERLLQLSAPQCPFECPFGASALWWVRTQA
jgi:hypothetical protein